MAEQHRNYQLTNSQLSELLKVVSSSISEDISKMRGEVQGEMRGLRTFMELRTGECKDNYVSLSGHMSKLTNKIKSVEIEKEVEERITGKFKRILYNRITLLCTIIGLAIGAAGLQNSNNKKSERKLIKISKELIEIKKGTSFENLEVGLK